MIFHICYRLTTIDNEPIDGDISIEWTKDMNTLSDFDSFKLGVKKSLTLRHPSWGIDSSSIVFTSVNLIIP